MVEGRLRKFYEEVVLLAQAFVHDPETTVAKAVAAAEKAAGAPIKITGFYRFALGEGDRRAGRAISPRKSPRGVRSLGVERAGCVKRAGRHRAEDG